MHREIHVQKGLGSMYSVSVGGEEFSVTVDPEYKEALVGDDVADETLIEASFEFLLDREPVGSILKSFDLQTIEKYFSEYRKEISAYLEKE